ncbi:MAG TPA: glycyl-radical enzyme activating protein, partial [Acetomicrobium flavidum]|nr:glycyl-radical enzyme activating protein [Acetomicrobium flavidum]
VEALAEFISSMKGLKEIELLPFHDISEKYNRLDKDYKMTIHKSPSRERLMEIKRKFEDIGLYVKL